MNETTKNLKPRWLIIFTVVLIALIAAAILIPNFIRARTCSCSNACVNSLRQMDGAKQQWALENVKSNGVACTENDIKPYIKLDTNGNLPKCPQGGKYTIGKTGEPPTCSFPSHVLP